MGKKDKPLVIVPLDDFRLNKQNREEHAEYMKKAEAGDTKTWEHIGGCYAHGVGCEKNLARALDCYRKAADMGNEDAKAALREIENR